MKKSKQMVNSINRTLRNLKLIMKDIVSNQFYTSKPITKVYLDYKLIHDELYELKKLIVKKDKL